MYCRVVLSFVSLFYFGFAVDLPSIFETCRPSDPDFNSCLKHAIKKILPALENGIPEMGIPPGQPISIPSLTVGEGKGTVHVVQNFKNTKIFNFFRLKVQSVEAKVSDTAFDLAVDVFVDDITASGDYEFNGRILVLPIVGKGKGETVFKNMKVHLVLRAEEVKKRGQAFFEIKDFKIKLTPEHLTMNFTNLFNGDKVLGNEMNKILNENWSLIWKDIQETYETTMGLVLRNLADIIFKKVPRAQMFPQ